MTITLLYPEAEEFLLYFMEKEWNKVPWEILFFSLGSKVPRD